MKWIFKIIKFCTKRKIDKTANQNFISGIPDPLLLTLISGVLNPDLNIFSSLFDVDCEEILLQLQMELIDHQCSEYLKSKFLVATTISIWTTSFYLDDTPTLSPTPNKSGTSHCCFVQNEACNDYAAFVTINYHLSGILLQSFHLTLTLQFFVITNNIRRKKRNNQPPTINAHNTLTQ